MCGPKFTDKQHNVRSSRTVQKLGVACQLVWAIDTKEKAGKNSEIRQSFQLQHYTNINVLLVKFVQSRQKLEGVCIMWRLTKSSEDGKSIMWRLTKPSEAGKRIMWRSTKLSEAGKSTPTWRSGMSIPRRYCDYHKMLYI